MKIHNCPQGSDEWLSLRLGIPTASEFDRIITPAKLQLASAAVKYMNLKLAEWMYGAPLEAFVSPWMERGAALEVEAVRYYEMDRGVDTQTVGIIISDDGLVGASPDRLVGDDGLLEMKCPSLETHVGYMLDPASLAGEYRLQVQGQLWVCQREWADIMSYYPGFPAVIFRVQPEERVFAAFDTHIPAFVHGMLKCRELLTYQYGELRRERVSSAERLEASRAAFDAFMASPIGGNA